MIVVGVALTPPDAPVETQTCSSAFIILEFSEVKAKELSYILLINF